MGWEASLELGFTASQGATALAHRAHRGPLYVQRPFRPEGAEVCHVYLLHPPGGLVGGDSLSVDIQVGAGAAALVTTPAAAKVYRSNGPSVRQTNSLRAAASASLEWLPQETIVFDGASALLETRIELAATARFIGAETLCFGLPARGEPFARGSCRQLIEIRRDGRPLLVERSRFAGGAPVASRRWGLGGATVLATLTAVPAPAAAVVGELRELAAAASGGDAAAVTVLGGETLVCRYLGGSAERARSFVHDSWRRLRPAVLGRPASQPRIWAT